MILYHFPQEKDPCHPHYSTQTHRSHHPLGLFWWRLSEWKPTMWWGCCVPHEHFFKIKMGLGQSTNNFAKLMTLKIMLQIEGEKGVRSIPLFEDSMNVINWSWKAQICHNIFLLPILEEIFKFLEGIGHGSTITAAGCDINTSKFKMLMFYPFLYSLCLMLSHISKYWFGVFDVEWIPMGLLSIWFSAFMLSLLLLYFLECLFWDITWWLSIGCSHEPSVLIDELCLKAPTECNFVSSDE